MAKPKTLHFWKRPPAETTAGVTYCGMMRFKGDSVGPTIRAVVPELEIPHEAKICMTCQRTLDKERKK